MLGAGGDGAADSVQSRKRLPPAEEGKEENADYPAGEDSGLPESSGGMGRPADVLSGTEYRIATRGAGGAAVERPQFADENADRVQICVARQGRAGRDRTENGKFCPGDLSQRRSDPAAGRRPKESPIQPIYVPVTQDRRDVWAGLRRADSQEAVRKAGIEEHVRFHDLRHTFSTLAIQSGIDPKTVAEILGHTSAEFSLDVYTHVTAGMKKEAAQKISGFMASVG